MNTSEQLMKKIANIANLAVVLVSLITANAIGRLSCINYQIGASRLEEQWNQLSSCRYDQIRLFTTKYCFLDVGKINYPVV